MSDLPTLLVGVPVLGRPQNSAVVAESLMASTPTAELLFICSAGDREQIEQATIWGDTTAVMRWEPGVGDFARKQNWGYRLAVEEGYDWYFVGADDLDFRPGWYEACLAAHTQTGACVIGTRDLGNARTMTGWHATHFLVHRDYAECGTIDEDGKLLCEQYHHEFCDDEAVQTARWRRTYAPSAAIVEHRHPDWGKAEWDDTYRKAQAHRAEDRVLFNSRRVMFGRGHTR